MTEASRTFDSPLIDLDDASVLVTGGTGSFGRAFVRCVLDRYKPRKIIVFSRDEMKQADMAQEFNPKQFPVMRYFLGDVRDADRLEMAMRDVDYVIHAAAMKSVPAAEYNPFECIHTNVMGAENIVRSALRTNVKKVIALSTDKAANPINIYGASKLASDKTFIAANSLAGEDGSRFAIVRYGNVLGSRGSVVPLFQRLIGGGATALPITDTRMTRFWITLDQGVNFVLSSLELMTFGEIFVPKLPSMKITALALAMAPDLGHENVGIRPGEKLHEVLITEDDSRMTYELADRYVIAPAFLQWGGLSQGGELQSVAEGFRYTSDGNAEWMDADDLRRMLGGGQGSPG
jgi:UDP-N-acetylglucosamine 4,6-dehydratase